MNQFSKIELTCTNLNESVFGLPKLHSPRWKAPIHIEQDHLMISTLELRHIIETAFLPTRCICSIRHDSLNIQLIDPSNQQELLTVAGIDPKALGSSRAIANLISEIKEEVRLQGGTAQKDVGQA